VPISFGVKKKTMRKMIAAVAGMFIGGMLYVLLRTDSLAMFKWLDTLAMQDEVQGLRFMARPHMSSLPQWVSFSLPQALWYFSGLLAFECIWGTSSRTLRQRRGWVLIFSSLAFGLEIGQFFHIMPGRFDPVDLALLFVAWGIVAVFSWVEQHRESRFGDA